MQIESPAAGAAASALEPTGGSGARCAAATRPARLGASLCLDDFEAAARRRLPRPIVAYISGAVERNRSLYANVEAFGQYDFLPRVLVDMSRRSTATRLLGRHWSAPFGLAPMGICALSAYRGDVVLAQAAARENVVSILSGSSPIPLEEVVRVNPEAWFQAYLPGDQTGITALVERVRVAGYGTLVVTVDASIASNRENNIRAGFSTPLRPGLRLAWEGISHPRWLFGTFLKTLLRHGMPLFENKHAHRGVPILSPGVLRDFSDRSHLHWQSSLSELDASYLVRNGDRNASCPPATFESPSKGTSMVGLRILERQRQVAERHVQAFADIPVANVSDCMMRMTAGGPRLRPMHHGGRLAGPALTVKARPGDNLMIHKALELAAPGDVVVVDAGGDLTNALFGELMLACAIQRRLGGIVLNGAIRDLEVIAAGSFPVYAAGVTHRGPYKDGPGDINVPIAIDGMVIQPGDLVLGDADGVLCVPFEDVEQVLAAAREKVALERQTLANILAGCHDTSWIDARLRAIGCDPTPR